MSAVSKLGRCGFVLGLFTAIIFAATRAAQSEEDVKTVAVMTENMKSVCVGRFLIDMPGDAQVELVQPRISGFNIVTSDESMEEFQTRLSEREAQIRAKPDYHGGGRNLELVSDVKTDWGLIGKILAHGRTITEGTRARGMDIERYRYESVAVEAIVHGNGVSIDIGSNDYFPDRIDTLNIAPARAGLSVDNACLRDPLLLGQHESITMFAKLSGHPDIEFMPILAAGRRSDGESLLRRDAAAEAGLPLAQRMRLTKLRASARTIGNVSGDEVIRVVEKENGARVHSFWWKVKGIENDVLVPHPVLNVSARTTKAGAHATAPQHSWH